MEYEDGKTPYHILGLEPNAETEDGEIKKASISK